MCWLCCQGKAECFICKDIDFVKWNARKKVPGYIRNNPALTPYFKQIGQTRKEITLPRQNLAKNSEKEKEVEESALKNLPAEADNSKLEPHLIKNEEGIEKETEIKFRFDDPPEPPHNTVSAILSNF